MRRGWSWMRRGRDRRTKVIQHHWDHRADTFDDEAGHGLLNDEQRRAWQELLSRLAGRPPRRVLDVGCGTGFLALRLGELRHEVTGVDLSPQMIDRARGKAEQEALQIEFRAGDATALADADGTYDLVVGRHLIWNLPHPERAVAEWLRVLRPGGRLALVEGKWADNTALQRSYSRGVSRILNRVLDATSALALRGGGHPPSSSTATTSGSRCSCRFPEDRRLAVSLRSSMTTASTTSPWNR